VRSAVASNNELRQLQSQMASKELEIRGDKAVRLPRVDLIAQYALLAKFNNYTQFYNTFQRNNGQIGASFQVPIFSGSGIGGQVAQAETDVAHLRVEMANVRNRITADLEQSYRDVAKAQIAAEVASLDLEVAHEQISVDLAQMQEGRLSMSVLEQARVAENAKWIALYDAQYALEKARWSVLRLTGQLSSAVVR
jgi:outer membrane protein